MIAIYGFIKNDSHKWLFFIVFIWPICRYLNTSLELKLASSSKKIYIKDCNAERMLDLAQQSTRRLCHGAVTTNYRHKPGPAPIFHGFLPGFSDSDLQWSGSKFMDHIIEIIVRGTAITKPPWSCRHVLRSVQWDTWKAEVKGNILPEFRCQCHG